MAIVRTALFAGTRWRKHPLVEAAIDMPMMIQRFIDTGIYPSHYRILMLFGEPTQPCPLSGVKQTSK